MIIFQYLFTGASAAAAAVNWVMTMHSVRFGSCADRLRLRQFAPGVESTIVILLLVSFALIMVSVSGRSVGDQITQRHLDKVSDPKVGSWTSALVLFSPEHLSAQLTSNCEVINWCIWSIVRIARMDTNGRQTEYDHEHWRSQEGNRPRGPPLPFGLEPVVVGFVQRRWEITIKLLKALIPKITV